VRPATVQLSAVGAHVPVAGGLAKALAHADRLAAEVIQVFVSNPRGWAAAAGDPHQDEVFLAGCARRGLPVFVHAPYLVNLGSPTLATQQRSVTALEHSLTRGRQVGARGVVVHAGSAVAGPPTTRARAGGVSPGGAGKDASKDDGGKDGARKQVRELLLPILDRLPDDSPRVLVEPTTGGGRALAARVEDLADYFEVLDSHPKLGVCLDTCHAWAAGHDLVAPGGLAHAIQALQQAVGPDRLALVHANDSRDPLGSRRDRHAPLGAGALGGTAFGQLFAVPGMPGVPIVVETPAETQSQDIALLKRLRDGG
jgi:deoxyribonuclease IV